MSKISMLSQALNQRLLSNPAAVRLLLTELLEEDPGILQIGEGPENFQPPNQRMSFAVFEAEDGRLYILGVFPAPSLRTCIRVLDAVACRYAADEDEDDSWRTGLHANVVAFTEDALSDDPIASYAFRCGNIVLGGEKIILHTGTMDTGNAAINEMLAVLRGDCEAPKTELGRAVQSAGE